LTTTSILELIDKAAVDRVDAFVESALSYAKPVVRGGRITEGPLTAGSFYLPCLLEVQELDVPLVQEEIFAPVGTFEVFDDEADALRRANATQFGLAAAVFTGDGAIDIDIVPDRTITNLSNLAAALTDLDAKIRAAGTNGLPFSATAESLQGISVLDLTTRFVRPGSGVLALRIQHRLRRPAPGGHHDDDRRCERSRRLPG
jgi:acyl-CoA reductase-like NAD-dependent aldehyde dehydrogenase